jgi:hypothetical protein
LNAYRPSTLTCASTSGDRRAASASSTSPLGTELAEGGVGVAGVPQHNGVEDQAERAELVLLPFAVGLAELAALAVEDLAGQPVAGILDGEL